MVNSLNLLPPTHLSDARLQAGRPHGEPVEVGHLYGRRQVEDDVLPPVGGQRRQAASLVRDLPAEPRRPGPGANQEDGV